MPELVKEQARAGHYFFVPIEADPGGSPGYWPTGSGYAESTQSASAPAGALTPAGTVLNITHVVPVIDQTGNPNGQLRIFDAAGTSYWDGGVLGQSMREGTVLNQDVHNGLQAHAYGGTTGFWLVFFQLLN